MTRNKLLPWISLTALAGLLAWQVIDRYRQPAEETVRLQQTLMGTLWSVQVWAPESDQAEVRRDIAAALAEVARVEAVMSEWREESPISLLNRSAGGSGYLVPPELAAIIERGIEYGRLSGGAFDITWKGMGDLWKLDDGFQAPSQEQIEEALSRVDYRLVELDGHPASAAGPVRIRLPRQGMALGLGGIAKGYGIDRAAAVLRKKGYDDFLIEGGGDVLTAGQRAGRPWRVGIQDPRGDDLLGWVEVSGGAVATSGDYQRFRMVEGVRYHHIIDPRSGRPARGCRSVTVLAPSAEQADALATAIFVLGSREGMGLAESLDNVEALIVDDEGDIRKSGHFPFAASSRADVLAE
ncbi:MAG TPA: FAD:protein FMN transferase [Acidobacteriota bacterium]|nr:FAD:protein FMN transferase [Acidobacteriota bacterium]